MGATVVEGDLPEDIADALRTAERIAVDTETGGLSWPEDPLLLCQVFSPATGPVLLRSVRRRPERLAAVLEDRGVTKVFHFAPFDLRFLAARWGVRTVGVECTKAASRLLDPDLPHAAHSLQSLVDRHLGITIAKGATRTSDWGATHLSPDQIAYAAADVAHLLDLVGTLKERLVKAGLDETFRAVCAYLPTDAQLEVDGIPNPLLY
ncbi:ribonuclease D [Ruania zhangjianzhongii]|uniref:ribonuclease D n=1 Tax=Ruania zhangjianzhongii TaxID=2603206 RepID=UPI0011CA3520|nr:ribonuclease D [Ruania zhangjianzhongii]